MIKRKKLGQHFLKSQKIAQSIVDAANLTKKDTVLEIGPGKGILTEVLCNKAKKVIAIEADDRLFDELKRRFSEQTNLFFRHGDGFGSKESFDVFVSNLPYSKSRDAIEWLAQQKFDKAVIMVQKEFAEKLTTKSKEKKAISVLSDYAFDIETVIKVGKNNFDPAPKIDSVVLRITQKNHVPKNMIEILNQLFSYRRKKLQNILKKFDIAYEGDNRLEEIKGDEIIKIAKQIIKK